MARSHRFTHSVLLGFAGQAITMVTGLWLSPFLLQHLGQHGFGFWIVGQQLLTYLALIDFGVVALLPRETAWATGRPDSQTQIPLVVARTIRILALQLPGVIALAALLWFVAARSQPDLRAPLGVFALAVSLLFSFRIFRALLEGLQDLAFISSSYMGGWLAGFLLSVGLVHAGFGLTALPAGWATGQAVDMLLCFCRVRARFRFALPSFQQVRECSGVGKQFGRGVWISISQIAQVLIYGTDAAVIGRLFGVAAVVPYSCTGKLVNVLANQPQTIMRAAEPGLSEMRTSANSERLTDVTRALSLAMLLASGVVATFTIAANPGFVRWWMGADNYSGLLLTILFALAMSLRHLNVTAIYTLFAFGQERFLAFTSLADGVLSTVFSIILAWSLHSTVGVVLGSILSTICVLFFGNAPRLSRELSVTKLDLAQPILGWFWRMLVAGSAAAFLGGRVLGASMPGSGLFAAGFAGAMAVSLYAILMLPVALESPLRPYLIDRWNRIRSLFRTAPEPLATRL